jgi:hypothetical protein
MSYLLQLKSKILFLIALLIFGTCSAQVYEGTIGKSTVTVCFGDAEDFSEDGVYYYDRHRSLIYLSRDESKTKWFEKEARLSDQVQGVWNLKEPVDLDVPQSRLRGEWSNPDGSKVHPIDLQLVEQRKDKDKDAPEACGSDAFHEKLERSLKPKFGEVVVFEGATTSQRGDRIKFQYQTVEIFLDPKSDVPDVRTVILNPGDQRYEQINRDLMSYSQYSGLKDRQFACRRETLRMGAPEGSWRLEIHPSLWTNDWLQVTMGHERFCGGPHPDGWEEVRVWNLLRGVEEDLAGWFEGGRVENKLKPNLLSVPTAILKSYMEKALLRYDKEGEDDCKKALPEAPNLFSLSLKPGGMQLWFEGFSYSMKSCADELLLPYESLYPYLNVKGKENLASILNSIGQKQ